MLRITRVVSLTGVIACCVAVPLAWQAWKPSPHIEETMYEPWIGLPSIVMDAGSPNTRFILRLAAASGTDLVHRCGWYEADATEKYVAHLGDPALRPQARAWHVDLEVHGDRIHAFVTDSGFPAPPPPPDCRNCTPPPPKQASAWFDKAQLEPIAQAWRDPRLWAAPQADSFCTDGVPAFLEACIEGRYAAVNRNCDGEGMDAALELWEAMQSLLPPPR